MATTTDKQHLQVMEKCRRQRKKIMDLLEYVDEEKDLLFQQEKTQLQVV